MTAATPIGQRELRNDNAEVMRRVAAGESFVVTRNGKPIADLIPHQQRAVPRATIGQLQAEFRELPPIDIQAWHADRLNADIVFGPDDPLEDPWEHRKPKS